MVNLVIVWLIFRWDIWAQLVPAAEWGLDFRDGLYTPGKTFSAATSGWPPLTVLVGRPFALLPFDAAYGVQVVVVACAAVGSAILSALLAVRVVPRDVLSHRFGAGAVDAQSLGVVLGCWLLTSYGFMYELWRGNINLYALVLVAAGGVAGGPPAAVAVVAGAGARAGHQPEAVSRHPARGAVLAVPVEGGAARAGRQRRAAAGRRSGQPAADADVRDHQLARQPQGGVRRHGGVGYGRPAARDDPVGAVLDRRGAAPAADRAVGGDRLAR